MVWDVSFTCDICGTKKGTSNHWWMLMLGDVPCFDQGQPSQRFTLLPWNFAASRDPAMVHLCGQGCAMQAMERFMANHTIERETSDVAEGLRPVGLPPKAERAVPGMGIVSGRR